MTSLSVPAPPALPRVAAVTSTLVFVRRSIVRSTRDTEALVMAIVLPTMLMLLFTYVFGGAIAETVPGGGSYVDYVTPGIILLCAGFGASSTAVDVAGDMTSGIVDRFRTLPVRSSGVITGHVVASVVRNLFATAVVVVVGLLVGFRPSADLWQWLVAIGVIAAFILAITWLYAAIGMASGSPQAANGYGFALLFLPYLSSAFVPTSTMPSVLRWIADHQPITPLIETLRQLLLGTPTPASTLWTGLAWCAGLIAVAIGWARWQFARRTRR